MENTIHMDKKSERVRWYLGAISCDVRFKRSERSSVVKLLLALAGAEKTEAR